MSEPIRSTSQRLTDTQTFRESIVGHLRERTEATASMMAGVGQRTREAAMYGLVEEVRNLSPDDMRLQTLYLLQRYREAAVAPNADRGRFQEGPEQARLIAQIGATRSRSEWPSGREILDELLHAGVEDLYRAMNERQRVHTEAQIDEAREQAAQPLRDALEKAEAREAEERRLHAETSELLTTAQLERDYLLALTGLDKAEIPEDLDDTYRRKKFPEDPPGVFRTKRKDGALSFEVKKGDKSWQTFASREEAIEAIAGPPPAKRERSGKQTGGVLRPDEIGIS